MLKIAPKFVILLLAMSNFFICNIANAKAPINTPWYSSVAIQGFDTVAYFTQNKAVQGSEDNYTKWKGTYWHFSSPENLTLFKANPEKYAPQYGGYCAYAIADENFASIEPEQFTIINNKLYLNYDAKIQAKWLTSPATYIKAADKNWPHILEQ